MTTMVDPRVTAPAARVPGTTRPVPGTRAAVPGTRRRLSVDAMRTLAVVAIGGGVVLAAIGFTGSYTALTRLGVAHGFGWFAHVFPVGVDAGIVVLLALDLYLARKDTPWPMLRRVAHLFTAATIYFNAKSTGVPLTVDPTGAAMHAVIPIMFVMSVDAGRRLVIRAADVEAGRESATVPLHRWFLAPWPTWLMFRRMKLWDKTYAQAVVLEQDRLVYRVMLDREYGDATPPLEALLPLTMARFGLSVEEALALPAEAEEAERLRVEEAEALAADADLRAEERAAERQMARLRVKGKVEAVRHEVEAGTGVAGAQARRVLAEAEAQAQARARTAAAEAAAEESADTAESNARAAEADRRAAEARKAAAETNRAALEIENRTTAEKLRAVEAKDRAAQLELASARADKEAAEARKAAVETRALAAETELRAVEAEDAAKLTPRERAARQVARMILTQGNGRPEEVELQTIADALGISVSTASERRKEAAELLAQGYGVGDREY